MSCTALLVVRRSQEELSRQDGTRGDVAAIRGKLECDAPLLPGGGAHQTFSERFPPRTSNM